MQGERGVQHTVVMVGGKIEPPAELESRAVRFSMRLPDEKALRKLKRWVDKLGAGLRGEPLPPGLDSRRGILLLGVQGCGKSWAAKAVAGGFGVPFLRLDFGVLPPELRRKGRFDEIFFVDLPKPDVREAVLALHLKHRHLDVSGWDIGPLVAASEGFSGAEIEQAVVIMAEQVNALREWASTRTMAAD